MKLYTVTSWPVITFFYIVFYSPTSTTHHDGVQTMGDGQHGVIGERLANRTLDEAVGEHVDGARGLKYETSSQICAEVINLHVYISKKRM